jgi:hypothetical protein
VAAPPASVLIEPASAELIPDETLQLEVTAFDASGEEIKNPKVTWTSLDPEVADFVTVGDRNRGELTALAEGGGTARIVADVDGVTATAVVTVVTLSARLFILEEANFELRSTEEELAQGTYRFRVITPPTNLDDLTSGRVEHIAGAQGRSFFRRVTQLTLSEDDLVIGTADAELKAVFKKGGKARGRVPLRFGPRGREARDCEPGRGVKCREPGPPAALAVPQDALRVAGLLGDLALFPEGFNICASPSKIQGAQACLGVGKAEVDGSFDVDLGLDVAVSVIPPEFELIASGGASFTLDFLFELGASVGYTIEKEITIADKPVTIMGIPGRIKLLLVPGASVSAGAAFELGFGASGGGSFTAGAHCDLGGCERILESSRFFDWHQPHFKITEANAAVRLFVVARLKLEWAGNEPAIEIGPFIRASGDASEFDHLDHDGATLLPRLHVGIDWGVQAGLAYEFKVFGASFVTLRIGADIFTQPILDWWGQGELAVATRTTGIDLDPDGYSLRVFRADAGAAPPWSASLTRTAPANGEVVFAAPGQPCIALFGSSPQNCHLVGTRQLLEVSALMWNCTVQGSSTTAPHLHPFARVNAAVAVECVSVFVALCDAVESFRASGQITSEGVAVALCSLLRNADAARQRGQAGAAANTLDAFIRLVEAQSADRGGTARSVQSRHIPADAAALLIERARLIQSGYLTTVTRG